MKPEGKLSEIVAGVVDVNSNVESNVGLGLISPLARVRL